MDMKTSAKSDEPWYTGDSITLTTKYLWYDEMVVPIMCHWDTSY